MSQPPKPEPHESKQGYLRRCVTMLSGEGMDEDTAFAVCALEASRHTLADEQPRRRLSAPVRLADEAQPGGQEPADAGNLRGFAILAYTGAEVSQWGYRFVIDLSGIRMAHNAVPALREHEREAVVGMTSRASVTEAGLLLHGSFLPVTQDAREVQALAEAGFPWQASIGVMPLHIEEIGQGASVEVNGRTFAGPIDVWRAARVDEISFVALGADGETAAVAMRRSTMSEMPEKNEDLQTEEQQPATRPAGDTQDEKKKDKDTARQDDDTSREDDGKGESLSRTEGERIKSILRLCSGLGLSAGFARDCIARGLSLAQAQDAALQHLEQRPGGRPVGHLSAGLDESDKFRRAAVEGLCLRQGLRVEKPAPGAEQFRALGPLGLARLCLSRAGERPDYLSASDVARRILSADMRLAASGQDYAAIFADVMHKFLMQGYEVEERTFLPLAERMTATDFRDMHGVNFSADLDLSEVPENAEYTYATPVATSEKFRVAKYGRIMRVSWEQIVNDDLSVFSRLPAAFGAAWGRKQNDIFYPARRKASPFRAGI